MEALECLASDLLPWWGNYIHENFSKRIRKGWSHDGANVLVESNKLYYLVVHTALRTRRNRELTQLKAIVVGATVGMRDLWELATFRDEFRIDVLGDRILDSRELHTRYIDVHPSTNEIQMHRQQMMRAAERNVDTLIVSRVLPHPLNRFVFAFLTTDIQAPGI